MMTVIVETHRAKEIRYPRFIIANTYYIYLILHL